jgi:hypothetical protein
MRNCKTLPRAGVLAPLWLLALVCGHSLLNAGPLIYSTADSGYTLATIDFATGETAVIGGTGQPLSLALAYDGSTLFTFTHGMDTNGLSQLATVDLTTGTANPYGITNNLQFMGVTFAPNGVLYAASSTDGNLYTIDLRTGAPTLIGPLGAGGVMGGSMMGGMGGMMGLAFHPNGNLFALDPMGELFQIDPTTAQATLVVQVIGLLYPMGLGIDADGNGYTVDLLAQATVYRFDLPTGQVTGAVETTLNFLHSALIMGARPPPLSAARQGGQLVVSWPASCTNCVLQATDQLGPAAAAWADWTNALTQANGYNLVTNSFLKPQRFFRLINR